MEMLVKYFTENLDQTHIMGYLQTPWCMPVEQNLEKHRQAAERLQVARQWYENR